MRFALRGPCINCPFRSDRPFYLGGRRAREIADSLRGGGTFACHKTVDYAIDDEPRAVVGSQFCGGALVILEREERPNQAMRIAERLDLYDHTMLDMAAPVFDILDEWVEYQYQLLGGGGE